MEKTGLEPKDYKIWVDWNREIVSFHEVAGFEPMPFESQETRQANIRILITAGFRFQ